MHVCLMCKSSLETCRSTCCTFNRTRHCQTTLVLTNLQVGWKHKAELQTRDSRHLYERGRLSFLGRSHEPASRLIVKRGSVGRSFSPSFLKSTVAKPGAA